MRVILCLSMAGFGVSLLGAVPAVADAAHRPPLLRVQAEMPDVMPDMPEEEQDEPLPFEEGPLEPGEMPPDEPPQAAQPDTPGDETAKAERPKEPDLDTLFEMLKSEDSEQARTRTAHRIQVTWLRSGSATVDLLMARASKALEGKEPELALDLLDAVVRFKPDYAAGWNRRAAAHFMAGHYGKALVDIERTLAIEPRHWGALAGLAAIQQATDEDGAALATYEKILEIYPHQEKAEEAAEELRKKTGGKEL